MTTDEFRRVRSLFDAAVEKPAAEREQFLQEACEGDAGVLDQVRVLLAARESPESWIDRPAMAAPHGFEGRRIGPYEVLREIASGGMGTVYLARRADGAFHMRVALKVLRPETAHGEVLLRFQQEREILASLDHPNIARILDGGEAEGFPYLAMEFVDGKPIDEYCDAHRLNVAQRLTLFRSVCGAIRYAHSRGVVHRDLKPSNILVTESGTVKLLDFGISKVLSSGAEDFTACVTRTGLYLMTPEYASPEQVRGESIGTGSDVYSLSVVLYELLTGHRPYHLRRRVFHEIVRVICDEPPTVPSTAITELEVVSDRKTITPESVSAVREGSLAMLRRKLAGDLDAVLLKGLEKQALRRYRSVDALDADIARHLEGRPVEARRRGWADQGRALYVRYSGWIWAAVALAVLMASGVVTVRKELLIALLAFSAAMAIVGGVYATELGGSVARRLVRISLSTAAAGGLIGVGLILLAPSALEESLLLVANISVTLVFLGQCIRWPLRERWAGRLLLEVGRPRPKWLYGLVCISVVGIVARFLRPPTFHMSPMQWGTLAQVAVITIWLVLLYTRAEIRQKGILVLGQFIPWRRIESRWFEREADRFVILRLACGGYRKIAPAFTLIMPRDKKEQAEVLMDRYLNEWPGSANAA